MNLFIIFSIFILQIKEKECKLFSDDPDIYRDVPAFLTSRGFSSQTHTFSTYDGYILTIFRIVNPYMKANNLKPKPVLMWHGLLDSAEAFIKNRKGRLNSKGVYSEDNDTVVNDCHFRLTSTLGFTLSACGYDVWLANSRGNQYSNKHTNMTTADKKYWSFSLNELIVYDLTATIRYVLKATKRPSISYIGYSMGNTIMFALLSLQPELERCIRPFIALAPVAFYSHAKGLFKAVAPIEPIFRSVNSGTEVGLRVPLAEFVGAFICGNFVLVLFCVEIGKLIFGGDPLNTDLSRLPVHYGNLIDTTSSRVCAHFAQLINSGRFAKYDYGTTGNLFHYKQKTSPDFPVTRIKSKHMYLFQGKNDNLGDPTDVQILKNYVPAIKLVKVSWPYWSHADPHMAKFENIFQDRFILKILQAYN